MGLVSKMASPFFSGDVMRIDKPLSFIHKKDLTEFDLEYVNGAWKLISGKFKQVLKKSEYDAIMETQKPVIRRGRKPGIKNEESDGDY